MSDKTVTFYGHWLSTPCSKVGLMLSMSGTDYAYHHVDLMTGEQKKPEFLALNRFGQVPVIVHDGNTICQSDVILVYLAVKLGKLDGATPEARLRAREWLAWQSDRLWNIQRPHGLIRFEKAEKVTIERAQRQAHAALDVLDQHVGGAFLVGDQPTIADLACFTLTCLADEAEIDIGGWSNIGAWRERMLAQPGCQHPYEIVPHESKP